MANIYCALRFRWQLLLVRKRLANIKLVVSDVDGVLTSGGLLYSPDGSVLKEFSVYDGVGVEQIQHLGIEFGILSGGSSGAVLARAKTLKISNVVTESGDKRQSLIELQNKLSVSIEETLFIGDDLNDLVVRDRVAIFVAPRNAIKSVRRQADLTLSRGGGEGCVRQLTDEVVKSHS